MEKILMVAHDQTFKDVTIYLDGNSFYRCRFENCTMVFSGVLGFVLEHPVVVNCNWVPQGPALQIIQLLSALYKGGAKSLVDGIIKNIRGEEGAPIYNKPN